MAKTKKHVMTKEELRAPDEFQVVLEGIWAKLVRYKKPILIAIVALVVAGIAIWIVGISKKSGADARGLAQRDASFAIGAAAGPKPEVQPGDKEPEKIPGVPDPLRYPDEAARLAASDAALAKYLGDHGGDDAAELAALAAANVALAEGKIADASTAVDAWLAKYPSSAVKSVALELKARVQLANGQRDAAATTLGEAATGVGGPLKAALLTRAGDLQNPALNGGQGDPAKAKSAYDEALASLPPLMPGADASTGPRGELENKKALIP